MNRAHEDSAPQEPVRTRPRPTRRAVRRLVTLPEREELPPLETVELGERGSTRVLDTGPRDAPVLVLLHALACTGLLTWYPAVAALREHYRVIVPDQRWHGQGIRSETFSLTECAHDVAALADALGIERFTLAGYSLGSLVAQLTWHEFPDRVAGLVLCASTSTFRGTRRERVMLDGYRTVLGRLPSTLSRPSSRADRLRPVPANGDVYDWALDQFRSTSPGAVAGALAEISRFDSTGWIGGVDVPTAVVVNTRDRMIPTAQQRALARGIPAATVHEVAAGHSACVLRAQPFVPAVLEACASVHERLDQPPVES